MEDWLYSTYTPTLITLLMFPIMVSVYAVLARREERDCLARFGDTYRDYKVRTPAFIPQVGTSRPGTSTLR